MMVQAVVEGDGPHDGRRRVGDPFGPDVKISSDFGADGIYGRHRLR